MGNGINARLADPEKAQKLRDAIENFGLDPKSAELALHFSGSNFDPKSFLAAQALLKYYDAPTTHPSFVTKNAEIQRLIADGEMRVDAIAAKFKTPSLTEVERRSIIETQKRNIVNCSDPKQLKIRISEEYIFHGLQQGFESKIRDKDTSCLKTHSANAGCDCSGSI